MIIYNVTININHDVHDNWLDWMRSVHIPDVMATGMFLESKMLRLLGFCFIIQIVFSKQG